VKNSGNRNFLAIFAPLPAVRKRTRLAKMVPIFQSRGYKVRFFGWERAPGELEEWRSTNLDERTILRGGGYASRQARLLYPLWMAATFLQVLRLGRGANVFCLGWETAFPALLASYFTGAQILFDDADRFSLIMRLPGPLHGVLQSIERWTSRRVTLHIVPSFSRYEWRGPNMVVLRNTPSMNDYHLARRSLYRPPSTGLVVYANGWIGETRGAPVFLQTLQKLAAVAADVKLVIAGRVDGPSSVDLMNHPLVEYRGELSQVDALAIYGEVDVALTYYDPVVPINRLAESNKWGDCVFLRIPFIVNDEVVTAAPFIDGGAAWAIPYSDSAGLADLLIKLSRDRRMLEYRKGSLDNFRSEYLPFDQQFNCIIDTFRNDIRDFGVDTFS